MRIMISLFIKRIRIGKNNNNETDIEVDGQEINLEGVEEQIKCWGYY